MLAMHMQVRVTRPLTNSNFVLDFFRYRDASYYKAMMLFLEAQEHSRVNSEQSTRGFRPC